MIEEDFPVSNVEVCDVRKWETKEKNIDVELTMGEENKEREHTTLSLFENNEDVKKSLVSMLQYHQTQQVEQEMVDHRTCLILSTYQHEMLHVF